MDFMVRTDHRDKRKPGWAKRGGQHLSNTTTCRGSTSSGDAEMQRNSCGDIKAYCNGDDLASWSARDSPRLCLLFQKLLIASIRRTNYLVTLATMDVFVSFICQIGQATAPSYLVKHSLDVIVKVCFRTDQHLNQ